MKIVVILAMFVLLTTACSIGSNIDTTLSLNDDLSGTRTMVVTVSDSLEEGDLMATTEELKVLVGETCPSELTWDFSDGTGYDVFTFVLAFSSKEDYERKVSLLLEEEKEITLEAPTSVWASGFQVQEDFTSEQLLNWLANGLVEVGFVAEENSSKIFEVSNTSVLYQGELYDCYRTIHTNQIQYVSLERIVIDTTISRKGVYERSIVFEIPTNSMDKSGSKITPYLEGIVPSAATSEWGTYDQGTTFEVVGRELTDETIQIFTTSVLDTPNIVFQTSPLGEEEAYFDFTDVVEEEIDLTSFTSDGYGVRLTYTITAEGSLVATSQMYGNRTSVDNPTIIMMDGYIDVQTAKYELTQAYPVEAVEVKVSGISQKDAKVKTEISIEGIPTQEEQETIKGRFQERGLYQDIEEEGQVSIYEVEGEEKDDTYLITLEQEITVELDEQETSDYGLDNLPIYLEISYESDPSITEVKTQNVIEASARLGNLASVYSEDFLFTYELNTGFFNTIEQIDTGSYNGFVTVAQYNSDYKEAETEQGVHEVSRNKYIFTSDSQTVHMNIGVIGSKWNLVAVLLYVAIAMVVVVVYLRNKKKKASMPPVENITETMPLEMVQEEVINIEEVEKVIFCESCGTKQEVGTKFCESCGNKLET